MKLLKSIYSILQAFSQARAATYYARQGNYTAAKKVMDNEQYC